MAKSKFNGSAKNEAAKDTSKKTLSDLSKMADTDKVTIVSEKRAGKTVMGVGEKPVAFDEDGKAEVTAKEAKYFLSIPGFELEEDGETDTSTSEDSGNADSAKTEESKDSAKTEETAKEEK